MKHLLLFVFITFCHVDAPGQSGGGFSTPYAYKDIRSTTFSDVTASGDTLIAYGISYTSDSSPYTGVVLALFDTLGQYIGNYTHQPLFTELMLQSYDNDLIQLKNGNFVCTGILFSTQRAFLSTFDRYGNFLNSKPYGINGIFTIFPQRLLEMPDGSVLMGGFYQKSDYTLKGFIKRIHPSGTQMWSRTYGQNGQNTLQSTILSLIQVDSNTFVLGSNQYSPQGTPLSDFSAKSWIFAIDSMGLIKWEWMSVDKAEVGVMGLQKTEDNGYIYLTGTLEIISEEESGTYFKVVRRDSALNLVWERTISDLGPTINRFGDLVPTPDGNWVASGTWVYRTGPGQDDVIFYNSLYKLNDQGDTLWSVRLKAPPGFEGTAYPGGMTVLPSGSVVWALRFDRFSPGPPQSFGWLIKVDNDGCVDTLCQLSSLAPEPSSVSLLVYPNPAQTSVTFEWPDQSSPAQLSVFDVTGRLIWTQEFQQRAVWEAADAPGGIYFYTVSIERTLLNTGKISIIK
jgi:hypothetical protein